MTDNCMISLQNVCVIKTRRHSGKCPEPTCCCIVNRNELPSFARRARVTGVTLMPRCVAIFAVLALAVSAPAALSAQDSNAVKQARKEVRHDRRELHGDRKDIRHDTKDIRQDRREVRQDLKNGDTTEARREARDLRQDRRDRRHDVRDARRDRRDLRQDRKDVYEDKQEKKDSTKD